VQAYPEETQDYNRYSYVWNNPLVKIDPSGEETYVHGGLLDDLTPFVTHELRKSIMEDASLRLSAIDNALIYSDIFQMKAEKNLNEANKNGSYTAGDWIYNPNLAAKKAYETWGIFKEYPNLEGKHSTGISIELLGYSSDLRKYKLFTSLQVFPVETIGNSVFVFDFIAAGGGSLRRFWEAGKNFYEEKFRNSLESKLTPSATHQFDCYSGRCDLHIYIDQSNGVLK
jgi:hypothetical protein